LIKVSYRASAGGIDAAALKVGWGMQKTVGLFIMTAAAIVAAWWWLGMAAPMPPSPLDPGEKLYCVSYAPFRGSQTPLDPSTKIEPWQIEQDFAQLSRVTDCVRTYSVDMGLDRVPEIARRHGLKVLLGVWVSSQPDRTQSEISTGIALARKFPQVVRAVIVGNEALLRGEVSAETLGEYIRSVKSQLPVPVSYADVWEFWLRYRSPSTFCRTGRMTRLQRVRPPATSMRSANAWRRPSPARRW